MQYKLSSARAMDLASSAVGVVTSAVADTQKEQYRLSSARAMDLASSAVGVVTSAVADTQTEQYNRCLSEKGGQGLKKLVWRNQ